MEFRRFPILVFGFLFFTVGFVKDGFYDRGEGRPRESSPLYVHAAG
jgi:hypothetical protein